MTNTDKWMIGFNSVIAVGGIISAIIFYNQLSVMQGQLKAMETDQRPWIKVEAEISQGLQVHGGDGILPTKFTLTNVGHTPAFNVQLEVWGFVSVPGVDIMAEQKERCERVRNQPLDNPARGAILFPGDSMDPSRYSFGASLVPHFSPEDVKNGLIDDGTGHKTISFWVYGCIDYAFGTPARHHQTGFIYTVARLIDRPGLPQGMSLGIDPTEATPADHLRLFPSPSASGQTD
jgi:hypothetical protein